MQTLTFTQKLLRQRRFFSSLLPLLTLFFGLGASSNAQAQSTIATGNVSLTTRQIGATTTASYDTQAGTPGATNFFNKDFGAFNLSTDAFTLNGGTITVNESAGDVFDQGELLFRVFAGDLNTATAPAFTSIALVNNGVSGGIRTFSLSSAARNLLTLAIQGSSTNASNRFDVRFRVTDNSGGAQLLSTIRKSVFTSIGSPIAATNIRNTDVFINTTGATTPNTTYGASSGATPLFQGANLGAYDVNTGTLTLNGGDATTFESGGDVVQNARLEYQIVKPAQNGQQAVLFPASNIALTQTTVTTDANGNTTRRFASSTALRNLIAGLANSGIGNFNLIVSFESDVITGAGGLVVVRDNNGGNGYVATFSTTGIPIQTDTWTGNTNDDWFTPTNWDLNRVPDAITNVVIPDFGTGSTKPYPNTNSGVTFTASNGAFVNNTASGPALSRNLNLLGSTQAQRTILRLINGRLKVFGDFTNLQDSFIQRQGTVFELAGVNQTFTGGSNFTQVVISGGGIKNLTGTMNIINSFTFAPNGGVVTTDVSKVNTNFLEFGDRSTNAPDGAQLVGETEAAYIRGFVRTTRANVLANEVDQNGNPDPRTFGNIGMTLRFKGTNNPGDVLVTRNTAESYTPLVTTMSGTTARYGIRRIFGVRPGSPNTNNGGLLADLTFRYRDAELTNLGPDGTGSVSEPNLALFVSTSGGNQFGFLGVDALDQVNNILTKNNVRTFATFTLGDRFAPLPVTLTGFDAKRAGNDAIITWQTATELNSRGYDVQVSTNGESFRTLAFVASEAPNSVRPLSYTYTDTERNKAGQRYYRLRQVDVDGKQTFFAPKIVNFEGKAVEADMTAYPNPFGSADRLHLTMQSGIAGAGQVRISDMTGRVVSQEKVDITAGSNDVTVSRLGDLKAGIYMVHFVLPSGEVQNLKVIKQ